MGATRADTGLVVLVPVCHKSLHLFRLIRKTSTQIKMQMMNKRVTMPRMIGSQLICCDVPEFRFVDVILKEANAGVG